MFTEVTSSSTARTDRPSATTRWARCSWPAGSSNASKALACPALITPAAIRRCTVGGSRSSRMVLDIWGRERLIRFASSSWVHPKSSSIC